MDDSSAAKVRSLEESVVDLLGAMDKAAADPALRADLAAIASDRATVQHYHNLLARAVTAGARDEQLRAANLLMGVNKGLGDAVWAYQQAEVNSAAETVTRRALTASQALRQELGTRF